MRLGQSGGLSALSSFRLKFAAAGRPFPPPPFPGTPEIRPVTSARGDGGARRVHAELRREGQQNTPRFSWASRRFYATEWRSPAGVSEPVVVELHPVTRRGTRFWIVEGVHARKRVKLPQEYVDSLLQQMSDLGALVPVDPARSPEVNEAVGGFRRLPVGTARARRFTGRERSRSG